MMKSLKRFSTLVILAFILVGPIALVAWSTMAFDRQRRLDSNLLLALRAGNIEETRSLLKEGADPNARDQRGIPQESLMDHIIAFFSHSHSPEMHRESALSYALDNQMATYAQMHGSPLELVKILLEYGADVKRSEYCDRPPLILAEEYGDIEATRFLLEHGADANVQLLDGTTALLEGIESGDPQLVQLLVDHGAHVDLKTNNLGLNDFEGPKVWARNDRKYAARFAQIMVILTKASKTH